MPNPFPLDQWFDTTRRISKEDASLTEAQMALNAVKAGIDPDGKQAHQEYKQMRQAVKEHNRKFAK